MRSSEERRSSVGPGPLAVTRGRALAAQRSSCTETLYRNTGFDGGYQGVSKSPVFRHGAVSALGVSKSASGTRRIKSWTHFRSVGPRKTRSPSTYRGMAPFRSKLAVIVDEVWAGNGRYGPVTPRAHRPPFDSQALMIPVGSADKHLDEVRPIKPSRRTKSRLFASLCRITLGRSTRPPYVLARHR